MITFAQKSSAPTEHKSGSNTTAYHNSVVQTQSIFALYISIASEGNVEIGCWNWEVFQEPGEWAIILIFQKSRHEFDFFVIQLISIWDFPEVCWAVEYDDVCAGCESYHLTVDRGFFTKRKFNLIYLLVHINDEKILGI